MPERRENGQWRHWASQGVPIPGASRIEARTLLRLPARLAADVDGHEDLGFLAGRPETGGAARRRAEKIEPLGDAQMFVARAEAERRVEADPADRLDIGLGPGVMRARAVGGVARRGKSPR